MQKSKKALRYVSFKEIPAIPIYLLFIALWALAAAVAALAMFADFRRFYLLMTPPLSATRITAGLWQVEAFSHCLRIIPKLDKLCHGFVKSLNNTVWADYSAILCSYDALLFGLVDLGCSNAQMLRLGSNLFGVALLMGSLIQCIAAILVAFWWFSFRTLRTRLATIGVLCFGVMVQLVGLGVYAYLVLLGSGSSSLMGLAFLGGSAEGPRNSFLYAFYAISILIIMNGAVVFVSAAAMRRDNCIDYIAESEELEDESCEPFV